MIVDDLRVFFVSILDNLGGNQGLGLSGNSGTCCQVGAKVVVQKLKPSIGHHFYIYLYKSSITNN